MNYLLSPNTPANQRLWKAVLRQDVAATAQALAEGGDPNVVWKTRTTVLFKAVCDGSEGVVAVLRAGGADPWANEVRACAPVLEAVRRGQLETVRCLLGWSAGAGFPEVDSNRWWGLFRASLGRIAELTGALLDRPVGFTGMNESDRIKRWRDLLHNGGDPAAWGRFEAIAPFPNRPARLHGLTAEWFALLRGSLTGCDEVLDRMLDRVQPEELLHLNPTEERAIFLEDFLALDWVKAKRLERVVTWMLASPPARLALEQQAASLIHAACKSGSPTRVRFLIGAMGKADGGLPSLRDRDGNTPLHGAVKTGHDTHRRCLLVHWLVQQGVGIEIKNRNNETALEIHCACPEPREDVLKALTAAGAHWSDTALSRLRFRSPALAARWQAHCLGNVGASAEPVRVPRRLRL